MLKKLFVLVAILFAGLTMYAQTEMQDVVYLKNGGMVKGLIIEQIPNVSLKVQTADGSIFVYKMEEVEKMAKEQVQVPTQKKFNNPYQNNNVGYNNNMAYMPPRKSTFAAGLLSFLIPGAGQLYATNWDKGWGFIAWTFLGYPIGIGIVSSIVDYDGFMAGLTALSIVHLIVGIYSIVDAVDVAKQVNINNGYLSFQIGDKARLGVRPEFSYNNIMKTNGTMSSGFTTGLGVSLNF